MHGGMHGGGMHGGGRYRGPRRPLGAGGSFVIAGIGLLIMVIATFGTMASHKRIEKLQATGVTVEAEVYDARRHIHTRYDSDGYERRTTEYYLTLRFEHPTGERYDREKKVSSSAANRYGHATRQSPIATTIVTDPNDPSNWEFASQLRKPGKGIFAVFAVISLAMFGLIGYGFYRLKNPPQMPPDDGSGGGGYGDQVHGAPVQHPGTHPQQHPGMPPQQHPGQHPGMPPQQHPGQ